MRAVVVCSLAFLVLATAPAAAQPSVPTPVGPRGMIEGTTQAFNWHAVGGATWYQLWVADALTSPKLLEWFTATQAGCAEAIGTCAVTLSVDLSVGNGVWWIRSYNASGSSAWSSGTQFILRRAATPWDVRMTGADRFQYVLGGAAAIDKETSLVWELSPSMTSRTWDAAILYCANRTVGGRKGWRLPAVHELATLYNPAGVGFFGGLPANHPFTGINVYAMWTTTPSIGGSAYIVSFSIGGNDGAFPQNVGSTFPAWCVRGQGGADR